MRAPAHRGPWLTRNWLGVVTLAMAAVLVLTACGSSSKTTTGQPSASITVRAANVPGFGTALVNGEGRTLYLLTSEKGGKLTCTDDNGCTQVWPDTELPKGTTKGIAGTGAQASLLGTVTSASGALYLTYGGWPLYTYSGDPGPGKVNGEGIVSFGGTWYAISPAGQPITAPSASTASAAGASGGGY